MQAQFDQELGRSGSPGLVAQPPSLWSRAPAWRYLTIASCLLTSLAISAPLVLPHLQPTLVTQPAPPTVSPSGPAAFTAPESVPASQSASQTISPPAPVARPHPEPMPAPQPAPQTASPSMRGDVTQQSCSVQLPAVPQHVTGRVIGFVTDQQVLATTKMVEAQMGAKESPAFLPLRRVSVRVPWQGQSFQTMAAIPRNLIVKIGDTVELNSRYRDPSLPCNFIPWTVIQIAEHPK